MTVRGSFSDRPVVTTGEKAARVRGTGDDGWVAVIEVTPLAAIAPAPTMLRGRYRWRHERREGAEKAQRNGRGRSWAMPTAGRQASAIGGCSWSSGGWPEHELAARLSRIECAHSTRSSSPRPSSSTHDRVTGVCPSPTVADLILKGSAVGATSMQRQHLPCAACCRRSTLRMRRSPKLQCESGRSRPGSSRSKLRTPASARHCTQPSTGRDSCVSCSGEGCTLSSPKLHCPGEGCASLPGLALRPTLFYLRRRYM